MPAKGAHGGYGEDGASRGGSYQRIARAQAVQLAFDIAPSTSASARPAVTPIAASASTSRRIMRSTVSRPVPSAIRMPISRVRRVTANAVTL